MPGARDNQTILETWDMLAESTVYVWVRDAREGTMVKKRVGGRAGGGSRVLHITSDDRRFNQEQVVEENIGNDPFTNGTMKLRNTEVASDVNTVYHLTNDDLRALLSLNDRSTFESEVEEITSELILRRLKDLAESEATIGQYTFIRDLCDKRYHSGGTQSTVREMMEEEAKRGATLS